MKKGFPAVAVLAVVALAALAYVAVTGWGATAQAAQNSVSVQEESGGISHKVLQADATDEPVPASAAEARAMERRELSDGDTLELAAGIVQKQVNGQKVLAYAYNGQQPGPLLAVKQGSRIKVRFRNDLPEPTTVHWHGLRVKNEFDGVPHLTQEPVLPGESFEYELEFPDAGFYWYHPHVREDRQQERGLYGLIAVEPQQADYFGEADREEFLVLDDILVNRGGLYPFGSETNFALMGRFGNAMLVNGGTEYSLAVRKGEVVRFVLLNAANVRPFRVVFEGARLRLVASDGGKYELETPVESITISPSERYVVEAVFDTAGVFRILNSNPDSTQVLGKVVVREGEKSGGIEFAPQRANPRVSEEHGALAPYFNAPPDFTYVLSVDIDGATHMDGMMMHDAGGVEWEDSMPGANSRSTSKTVRWVLRNAATGKENMYAVGTVPTGRPFKIKLVNPLHSLHPMQHPIHLHGTRFLVAKIDGKPSYNLAWKDTVLIPAGGEAELVAVFEKEGKWMLHCHIAEHLSSGMMTVLEAVSQ